MSYHPSLSISKKNNPYLTYLYFWGMSQEPDIFLYLALLKLKKQQHISFAFIENIFFVLDDFVLPCLCIINWEFPTFIDINQVVDMFSRSSHLSFVRKQSMACQSNGGN